MGGPLTDATNGFRAVKVDLLERMDLRVTGFPIIMEEVYKAKFLSRTFCEVPYILTSRIAGAGASKFRYWPWLFWDHLKYAVRARLGLRPHLAGKA